MELGLWGIPLFGSLHSLVNWKFTCGWPWVRKHSECLFLWWNRAVKNLRRAFLKLLPFHILSNNTFEIDKSIFIWPSIISTQSTRHRITSLEHTSRRESLNISYFLSRCEILYIRRLNHTVHKLFLSNFLCFSWWLNLYLFSVFLLGLIVSKFVLFHFHSLDSF